MIYYVTENYVELYEPINKDITEDVVHYIKKGRSKIELDVYNVLVKYGLTFILFGLLEDNWGFRAVKFIEVFDNHFKSISYQNLKEVDIVDAIIRFKLYL